MIVQMGHGNTKRYLSPGPISIYFVVRVVIYVIIFSMHFSIYVPTFNSIQDFLLLHS